MSLPRPNTVRWAAANTNEELWGYFIERLFFRCVQKITFLPTNGYTVCDLNSQLNNKSFTFTAKYVNVFNNHLFSRTFSITPKGTLSVSGDSRNIVLSVELSDKFYSDQDGVGIVGETNEYALPITSLMELYELQPPQLPKVGSTVFHRNQYQTEIVEINTGAPVYRAITISAQSTDVWYLMNDTRNRLLAHMADYNNPHRVSLSQAENYQNGQPLIVGHEIYKGSVVQGSKYITYNEAVSISYGGSSSLYNKFHSSQNGSGNVGQSNSYSVSLAIPYINGQTLQVGSTVFLANRYEVVVTYISSGTFTGQTVSMNSNDISYILWNLTTLIDAINTNIATIFNRLNNIDAAIVVINNTLVGLRADLDALTIFTYDLSEQFHTHLADFDNPHKVTLSQAEVEQNGEPLIINHNIYKNEETLNNKLVTHLQSWNIATEVCQGASLYQGVIKYAVVNYGEMNTLQFLPPSKNYILAVGDRCAVLERKFASALSIYTWDGAKWVVVPFTPERGAYYHIMFWFGTWYDGIKYNGEVTAKITCVNEIVDPITQPYGLWGLLVFKYWILNNTITNKKIFKYEVNDVASSVATPTDKEYQQWLQQFYSNIKSLQSDISTVNSNITTLSNRVTNISAVTVDWIGQETVTSLTSLRINKKVINISTGANQNLTFNTIAVANDTAIIVVYASSTITITTPISSATIVNLSPNTINLVAGNTMEIHVFYNSATGKYHIKTFK
jgi:hypothetical protein